MQSRANKGPNNPARGRGNFVRPSQMTNRPSEWSSNMQTVDYNKNPEAQGIHRAPPPNPWTNQRNIPLDSTEFPYLNNQAQYQNENRQDQSDYAPQRYQRGNRASFRSRGRKSFRQPNPRQSFYNEAEYEGNAPPSVPANLPVLIGGVQRLGNSIFEVCALVIEDNARMNQMMLWSPKTMSFLLHPKMAMAPDIDPALIKVGHMFQATVQYQCFYSSKSTLKETFLMLYLDHIDEREWRKAASEDTVMKTFFESQLTESICDIVQFEPPIGLMSTSLSDGNSQLISFHQNRQMKSQTDPPAKLSPPYDKIQCFHTSLYGRRLACNSSDPVFYMANVDPPQSAICFTISPDPIRIHPYLSSDYPKISVEEEQQGQLDPQKPLPMRAPRASHIPFEASKLPNFVARTAEKSNNETPVVVPPEPSSENQEEVEEEPQDESPPPPPLFDDPPSQNELKELIHEVEEFSPTHKRFLNYMLNMKRSKKDQPNPIDALLEELKDQLSDDEEGPKENDDQANPEEGDEIIEPGEEIEE